MRMLNANGDIIYDSALQRSFLELIQHVLKLLKVFACGSIGSLLMYRIGFKLLVGIRTSSNDPPSNTLTMRGQRPEEEEKKKTKSFKPLTTIQCMLHGGCFAIGLWIFTHPWLSSMYELNQSSVFYIHQKSK